jgi:hypothetical protein
MTMSRSRLLPIILAFLFGLCVAFPSPTRAQDETAVATPDPEPATCTFSADNPLVISGAEHPVQLGDAAVDIETTFDESCNPISVVSEVPVDAEATSTGSGGVRMLSGEVGRASTVSRNASMSAVCHASARTHDVIPVTLTHSHTYAKWYYDGTYNTGRSFSASSTSEDHLNDGWTVNDGPWFFWYCLSNPVGAEGWTGFNWIGGLYSHELRAILWMYGNGGCYADFYISGTLCQCIHVHTRYYVNGG